MKVYIHHLISNINEIKKIFNDKVEVIVYKYNSKLKSLENRDLVIIYKNSKTNIKKFKEKYKIHNLILVNENNFEKSIVNYCKKYNFRDYLNDNILNKYKSKYKFYIYEDILNLNIDLYYKYFLTIAWTYLNEKNKNNLNRKNKRIIDKSEFRKFFYELGYRPQEFAESRGNYSLQYRLDKFLNSYHFCNKIDENTYELLPKHHFFNSKNSLYVLYRIKDGEKFKYKQFHDLAIEFLYAKPQENNTPNNVQTTTLRNIADVLKISHVNVHKTVEKKLKVYKFKVITEQEYQNNIALNNMEGVFKYNYKLNYKKGKQFTVYLQNIGSKLISNLQYRTVIKKGNKIIRTNRLILGYKKVIYKSINMSDKIKLFVGNESVKRLEEVKQHRLSSFSNSENYLVDSYDEFKDNSFSHYLQIVSHNINRGVEKLFYNLVLYKQYISIDLEMLNVLNFKKLRGYIGLKISEMKKRLKTIYDIGNSFIEEEKKRIKEELNNLFITLRIIKNYSYILNN